MQSRASQSRSQEMEMDASVRDRGFFTEQLADRDPEVAGSIDSELGRQRREIELIASENIVSQAMLEAQGSVLTNKYAEGYPGRRYYGGCEYVDVTEQLAIDRACQLFGAKFANVQPHSGAQANQAVNMALLQPGDTILDRKSTRLNSSHVATSYAGLCHKQK